MSRERKTYTVEQKEQIMALVAKLRAEGMPLKKACETAGTSDHNLYNWQNKGLGKKKPKSYASAKLLEIPAQTMTPPKGRVFVLFGSAEDVANAVRSLS